MLIQVTIIKYLTDLNDLFLSNLQNYFHFTSISYFLIVFEKLTIISKVIVINTFKRM